ncbi:unnamed protein product [Ranitomeya imitator]|uniref:Signal peptide peptidase-like 3 n=1 Tax=Ranitomeya imitator TaxID=111125 RepID=A0ABN9M230_9NEOB|nr:unnamed protein product [Ranitomeya imitator]
MFFFFDSVQVVFTICTAVLATIAFAFLLLPMCQYLTRPCSPQNKISFGCCGRFTVAELLSFSLSVMLVLIWVLTGHWLLMDALAMGLCVAMIAFVRRLPSLKVSCLLLSGLLIYDVFWVFFSAYIFNSNVMVKVATQPADNPLDVLSRKLHLGPNVGRDIPRLSLPGKLVFPSSTGSHFSMLGIGDIVMPGLLLCFVLRYDNYKKQATTDSCGAQGTANISGRMQKVSYFHCTLIGYFVGLLTATVASRIHRAAQPALLYLVPFTLLPLLTMAYLKGDLRRMWSEPFHTKASSSRFLENTFNDLVYGAICRTSSSGRSVQLTFISEWACRCKKLCKLPENTFMSLALKGTCHPQNRRTLLNLYIHMCECRNYETFTVVCLSLDTPECSLNAKTDLPL